MAPVLARLVRMLAGLCLVAAVAVVGHACVWGVLAFTQVRTHGLVAMTNPERLIDSHGEIHAPMAPQIRAVTGGGGPTAPAVGEGRDESAADAEPKPVAPTAADRSLAAIVGVTTFAGVGSMLVLPIVLVVGFVTALVRAPRAAGATMGGIVWALVLVALVLPWVTWWPQLPWPGLFLGYDDLVAEIEAVERAGGPMSVGPLVVHVVVPAFAVAVLVLIAWRCGEALHAELLSAESLLVDPAIERDASEVTARGACMSEGRVAKSFAANSAGSSVPGLPALRHIVEEAPCEAAPRRLI